MKQGSITAGELIAKLKADPEFQKKKAERDAQMAVVFERRKKDEAGLVAELRAVGYEVDSVYDFVNTRKKYPDAIPVLIRHLDLAHEPVIREGIARALTIKYGGAAVEVALLRHFENETDRELRWVFANALETAMPLARRKNRPEIGAAFRRNTRNKEEAQPNGTDNEGLHPTLSDLIR